MKKLFLMSLIVVSATSMLFVGCQKDVAVNTSSSNNTELMSKFDESKALKKLSEIPYSSITSKKGVLQFESLSDVRQVAKVLYEADRIWKEELKTKTSGWNDDEMLKLVNIDDYIYQTFESNFTDFQSLRSKIGGDENQKYVHLVRFKPLRAIMNQFSEFSVNKDLYKEFEKGFIVKVTDWENENIVDIHNLTTNTALQSQSTTVIQGRPRENDIISRSLLDFGCNECEGWEEENRTFVSGKERYVCEVGIYNNNLINVQETWAEMSADKKGFLGIWGGVNRNMGIQNYIVDMHLTDQDLEQDCADNRHVTGAPLREDNTPFPALYTCNCKSIDMTARNSAYQRVTFKECAGEFGVRATFLFTLGGVQRAETIDLKF